VTAVTLTIEMAAAMAASLARLNKNETLRVSIETTGVPSSVSKLWTALLTRTASP
jgi:Fe-S cluster assembly iron-binding protein IscA